MNHKTAIDVLTNVINETKSEKNWLENCLNSSLKSAEGHKQRLADNEFKIVALEKALEALSGN